MPGGNVSVKATKTEPQIQQNSELQKIQTAFGEEYQASKDVPRLRSYQFQGSLTPEQIREEEEKNGVMDSTNNVYSVMRYAKNVDMGMDQQQMKSAKPSMEIMVEQPQMNTREAVDKNLDPGHSSVKVEFTAKEGGVYTRKSLHVGFHPRAGTGIGNMQEALYQKTDYPGEVQDDSGTADSVDVRRRYILEDGSQIPQILKMMDAYDTGMPYNLIYNNCTTFARNVANVSGAAGAVDLFNEEQWKFGIQSGLHISFAGAYRKDNFKAGMLKNLQSPDYNYANRMRLSQAEYDRYERSLAEGRKNRKYIGYAPSEVAEEMQSMPNSVQSLLIANALTADEQEIWKDHAEGRENDEYDADLERKKKFYDHVNSKVTVPNIPRKKEYGEQLQKVSKGRYFSSWRKLARKNQKLGWTGLGPGSVTAKLNNSQDTVDQLHDSYAKVLGAIGEVWIHPTDAVVDRLIETEHTYNEKSAAIVQDVWEAYEELKEYPAPERYMKFLETIKNQALRTQVEIADLVYQSRQNQETRNDQVDYSVELGEWESRFSNVSAQLFALADRSKGDQPQMTVVETSGEKEETGAVGLTEAEKESVTEGTAGPEELNTESLISDETAVKINRYTAFFLNRTEPLLRAFRAQEKNIFEEKNIHRLMEDRTNAMIIEQYKPGMTEDEYVAFLSSLSSKRKKTALEAWKNKPTTTESGTQEEKTIIGRIKAHMEETGLNTDNEVLGRLLSYLIRTKTEGLSDKYKNSKEFYAALWARQNANVVNDAIEEIKGELNTFAEGIKNEPEVQNWIKDESSLTPGERRSTDSIHQQAVLYTTYGAMPVIAGMIKKNVHNRELFLNSCYGILVQKAEDHLNAMEDVRYADSERRNTVKNLTTEQKNEITQRWELAKKEYSYLNNLYQGDGKKLSLVLGYGNKKYFMNPSHPIIKAQKNASEDEKKRIAQALENIQAAYNDIRAYGPKLAPKAYDELLTKNEFTYFT